MSELFYSEYFEREITLDELLENAKDDLREALEENIEGMVESHCEAWKERYYRKGIKAISVDLYINHDSSCEMDFIEDQIGRELEEGEHELIKKYFNESVLNEFR